MNAVSRTLLLATCTALSLGLSAVNDAPAASSAKQDTRTKVLFLGTGTPAPDPDRFGPATVVLVDSTAYLFDVGVGVVRRWSAALRRGVAPLRVWDLNPVFITHLHTDHTLGLSDLIFSGRGRGNRALLLYGPPGVRSMSEHLLSAYSEDVQIRTGPGGGEMEGSAPPRVTVTEIDTGVVYRDARVTITAFRVHHGTWKHAFGYRVQTPDKVIVISGDAAPPSAIPDQCMRCDILIHEGGAFDPDSLGTSARRGAYSKAFHTSAQELAEIAQRARPKLLILTHQGLAENQRGLELLRSRYRDGRVEIAKDFDVFQ